MVNTRLPFNEFHSPHTSPAQKISPEEIMIYINFLCSPSAVLIRLPGHHACFGGSGTCEGRLAPNEAVGLATAVEMVNDKLVADCPGAVADEDCAKAPWVVNATNVAANEVSILLGIEGVHKASRRIEGSDGERESVNLDVMGQVVERSRPCTRSKFISTSAFCPQLE